MAGIEFLKDQGLRMDGRRPTELRRISCKLGVSANADGSAYFEQGNTKVLATVYGPHDASKNRSKASNDRAFINCELRAAPFSTSARNKVSRNDRRSQDMSIGLKRAFEGTILTTQHPNSQIDIFFLILYSDGGTPSACINAGTLALINAGIPLRDYLCACSAGFLNETALTDINHLEGIQGGTELNLALLHKSGESVYDEMTSRVHKDHMAKIRSAAIRGSHDIYAILDAAVKKHAAIY